MATPNDLLEKLLATEKDFIFLQSEYMELADQYYELRHPFNNNHNTNVSEATQQDIDNYLELIHHCMRCGNNYLLDKWGIRYVHNHKVLSQPDAYYMGIFQELSNPNNCEKINLKLGTKSAPYFDYLFNNFLKTNLN